jgi:hypothetical protein
LLVAFAPLVLAGAIPFYHVLRGARPWRWWLFCWLSLIFWMFVFCFVVPLTVGAFSAQFAHEIFNWVPEGPAVAAMLMMGWFPAGVLVTLAAFIRQTSRWLKRFSGEGGEP